MPALAQKTAPDYYDNKITIERRPATKAAPRKPAINKTASRRRWQEEKPGSAPRVASRLAPNSHEVEELLSHFGHGDAARGEQVRALLESKRGERRRARLRHRPFRLTLAAAVLAGAPLFLVASLLWLRSSALAMSRSDTKVQDQINAARFSLQATRKEIAAMNASPHLEQWAKERHWQRATQKDFDQVNPNISGATEIGDD